MSCESDMHYRELCSSARKLEEVYDVRGPQKLTHGFIATHLHNEDWPRICLQDSGIGGLAGYVGYIETTWFHHLQTNSGRAVGQALPPKMLFTKAFLDELPTYFHGTENIFGVGALLWYRTIQVIGNHTEEFIHCDMQGHIFVWNLRPEPKNGSCEKGCHTMGLWRD